MTQKPVTNDALVESLFEVFRCQGYEGTTISQLAKVTGLQKSSLYHHFPRGKDDMVKAVVRYVSLQLHDYVISPLSNMSISPQVRLNNMVAAIKEFYRNGEKNCLLNALSLGEAKVEISEMLKNDYSDLLTALTNIGKEIGLNQHDAKAKSVHFLIAIQGALVIQRLTNDVTIFENSVEFELKNFLNSHSANP